MNRYLVVGLSHKTAPVELRERCTSGDQPAMLAELAPLADEVVLVSTCNRFEVYSYGAADADSMVNWIAGHAGTTVESLREHAYVRQGTNACKHLFFVTSSLDSLVVGETQVRGQVRDAYQVATEQGTVGPMLHRLFQAGLRVAKAISETTGVGRGNVSVAGAAADLAEKIFSDLSEARVLVLGAGETAELVVSHLLGRGVAGFTILNRTEEHARELAEKCDGRSGGLDLIEEELKHADILVCAAGGEQPLVGVKPVKRAMRKRRGKPVVAIDIAVPRGLDPRLDSLDNFYRYDMDMLEAVTRDALRHRRKEFIQCCTLVDAEALRVDADTRAQRAGGTIKELELSFEEVARDELRRLERRLPELDEDDRQRVRDTIRRIVRRLLHGPVKVLREGDSQDHETIRKVFVRRSKEGDE